MPANDWDNRRKEYTRRYRRVVREELDALHFQSHLTKAEIEASRSQVYWVILSLEAAVWFSMLIQLLPRMESYIERGSWGSLALIVATFAVVGWWIGTALFSFATKRIAPTTEELLLRFEERRRFWRSQLELALKTRLGQDLVDSILAVKQRDEYLGPNQDGESDDSVVFADLCKRVATEHDQIVREFAKVAWKNLRDEDTGGLIASWGVVADSMHSANNRRLRSVVLSALFLVVLAVVHFGGRTPP